ncbi:MAG: mechanosensitive ion channel family protein [Clostridia bacterium]|nr:mechanosensitive ion channel family protein [Clostridia bacterium]
MPNMVFDTVPSSDEALQEFVDSVESLGLKQWLIGIGLFLLLLIVTHFLMRLFTKRLDKSERISKSLHTVLVTVVRFALILASILIASNAVGISLSGVLVLFGVFGAAVTLAAQGILSNIAGCIILLSGRMFEVDDYIETPSGSGTVKEINLLNTKLLSYEGATIYIPNSVLIPSRSRTSPHIKSAAPTSHSASRMPTVPTPCARQRWRPRQRYLTSSTIPRRCLSCPATPRATSTIRCCRGQPRTTIGRCATV